MLEVCNLVGSDSAEAMKHPDCNSEEFEFNLGSAPQLRCGYKEKATMCGKCETCLLTYRVKSVKEWFLRLGDHSKRRFMLGLLRRIHSVDLLKQLVSLLQPLTNKDFVYARMRTKPSLDTDISSMSSDRALKSSLVEQLTSSTWDWFAKSTYWTKANFALTLLHSCDIHLLHVIGSQARTLLVLEEDAAAGKLESTNYEASSIGSSYYTYHTDDHPELELLVATRSQYGRIEEEPFTGESLNVSPDCIINCDSSDESLSDDTPTSVDPSCFVVPTASKAYSGVARYRDFIRCLPVHIAKYILSFLDRASLNNALCVNRNWRVLVEEVHDEFYVNQQLWEEVMLMQGAAAQSANPFYANDIDVEVPKLLSGSSEVMCNDDAVVKTTFKSEVSFATAYSGIETQKVIMEERNVYCGAYNVMVLCTQEDVNRVMHTDGGKLIALGSKDRKVRFIDCESGKEKGPVITGHAGSVRCVCLYEAKGIVLSGSYDTSIRGWSIETGHCMKIFRGHRDTVVTLVLHGEVVASGSKDKSCKIWDMHSGKCTRTFRHKYPVMAVALSRDLCISGCEGGSVKVWNLASGELVKTLKGHKGPVTAIKFDRWHIITGSRDGYALAWSTIGKHSRCLTALRHPKEVLCLEFMYLRVITGSADGRLRIWNILTGQCCRIMRGNSRSDPIESIICNGNRITLNTHNNLLVLNFEHIEWDYTLETDKVPSLVQYGSYSDAPIRKQPYPYIRAQRMKLAGASNSKIIHHKGRDDHGPTPIHQSEFRAAQLSHSAKTLSERYLNSARSIQTPRGVSSLSLPVSPSGYSPTRKHRDLSVRQVSSAPSTVFRKPPTSPPGTSKSRPPTAKSQKTQVSVKIADQEIEEEEGSPKEPPIVHRRVSWAFEKPLVPVSKDVSLSEMKALLRSQIRMKSESIIPPDFIYLTVNAIQNSMKPSETSTNTDLNVQDCNLKSAPSKVEQVRPSSSPSRIDPRTKVPVEELHLEQFLTGDGETASEFSDLRSVKSLRTKEQPKTPVLPDKEVYQTRYISTPVKPAAHKSLHPKRVKSTLPRGRVIRPISAATMQKTDKSPLFLPTAKNTRPFTAPAKTRLGTMESLSPSIASYLPGGFVPRPKTVDLLSSAQIHSHVPMLMYSQEVKDKIRELKERQQNREQLIPRGSGIPLLGKVSPLNDPLRSHIKFELRTHKQEQEYIANIERMHQEQRQREEEVAERKKRAAWLAITRVS